jgi:hypothetical protein
MAGIVFACTFGGALVGMALRRAVPNHHLGSDSEAIVRLAMGLIATMAALVLGLLTASAKTTFDTQDGDVRQSAADILMLDRVLAQYGPETAPIRNGIHDALARRVDTTWPDDGLRTGTLDTSAPPPALEQLDQQIRRLTPTDDFQRGLQARALQLSGDIQHTRWMLFGSAPTLQLPMLVVLVSWITIIFLSFGLYSPHNVTVACFLALAALSVAGSVFLILEMGRPFEGLIRISSAPMRYALSNIDH